MIGTLKIAVNASNPQLALPTVYTYATSPSSIRILDVPKKIGKWQITNVAINMIYPDGSNVQTSCVLIGGVWVGTLQGNSTTGVSKNGITIYASGVDENGNNVSGYVLGKGDLIVLEDSGETHPEIKSNYVKLFDELPENPSDGNLAKDGSDYYIWQDGEANALGVTHTELDEKADASDLENYYTKSEVNTLIESVEVPLDDTLTPSSTNAVKSSGLWSSIWGALSSLPYGFSSLYDWCVDKFSNKANRVEIYSLDKWPRQDIFGNTIFRDTEHDVMIMYDYKTNTFTAQGDGGIYECEIQYDFGDRLLYIPELDLTYNIYESRVACIDEVNKKLGKKITNPEGDYGGIGTIVCLTQAQYDALTTYDNRTLYVIKG